VTIVVGLLIFVMVNKWATRRFPWQQDGLSTSEWGRVFLSRFLVFGVLFLLTIILLFLLFGGL
jgi:hypothetical protein